MNSTIDALVASAAENNAEMGNDYSQIHNNELARNRCLVDLRLTDPRDDKIRIEKTQGGLHRPSYKWILENPDFRKWQNDKQARLLWVKGDAGKGKTMLLCGIINELSQSSKGEGPVRNAVNAVSRSVMEVALRRACIPTMPFFFCQASDGRLNNATAVLRGVMYLLLFQQPSLISHIQDIYEHEGRQVFEGEGALDILARALTRMLCDDRAKACYIIIDALDEIKSGLQHILEFIVQTSQLGEAKWIVSSRDADYMELPLARLDSEAWLSLDLNTSIVSPGINAYINHKLAHLKSIRCKRQLRAKAQFELQDKADGTFLWVTLVSRQVENVQSSDILRVLGVMPPGIEHIYDRVMMQIERLDEDERRHCHAVLSIVTTAYRPLSLEELGMLSGISESVYGDDISRTSDSFYGNGLTVESVVKSCAPFLTVQDGHVYLLHKSVMDFLHDTSTGPSKASPGAHYDMFSTSVHIMSKVLCRDIYGLQRPDTLTKSVLSPKPDPLASVRYSCLHWVDHLHDALSNEDPNAIDVICNSVMINTFLGQKYLNWLEALSLLHEVPRGVSIMSKLQTLLERRIMENVADLVQDANRFVICNQALIEKAPLQIYASALILNHPTSFFADTFEQEAPKWIKSKTNIDITPSDPGETLEGYSAAVLSVSFSKRGQRIASVSHQNVVRIWDVATGQCLQKINETEHKITCVAFSADEQHVALGSDLHDALEIWDTNTNLRVRCLSGLGITPATIDLSEDGALFSLGSHSGGIIICNANTGQIVHKMDVSSHVSSVAFSADGKLVASASEDNTIRIWDAATGQCVYKLMVSRAAHSVIFDQSTSSLLVTDIGSLNLDLLPRRKKVPVKVRNRSLKLHGYGIETGETWVVKDGAKLLWLPTGPQPVVAVGSGRRMVVSYSPSSLLIIEFAADNMDN